MGLQDGPGVPGELDWADGFVREQVEPLDHLLPRQQFMPLDGVRRTIVDPLKEEVRRQGLWATHLGEDLGRVLVDGGLFRSL